MDTQITLAKVGPDVVDRIVQYTSAVLVGSSWDNVSDQIRWTVLFTHPRSITDANVRLATLSKFVAAVAPVSATDLSLVLTREHVAAWLRRREAEGANRGTLDNEKTRLTHCLRAVAGELPTVPSQPASKPAPYTVTDLERLRLAGSLVEKILSATVEHGVTFVAGGVDEIRLGIVPNAAWKLAVAQAESAELDLDRDRLRATHAAHVARQGKPAIEVLAEYAGTRAAMDAAIAAIDVDAREAAHLMASLDTVATHRVARHMTATTPPTGGNYDPRTVCSEQPTGRSAMRVSKAEARRRRAAKVNRRLASTMDEVQTEWYSTYAPRKMPEAVWREISDVHHEIMTTAGIKGLQNFKMRSSELALYLDWRYATGQSTGVVEAMTIDAIGQYQRHGNLTDKQRERGEPRGRLIQLAHAVNPDLVAPALPPSGKKASLQVPYSEREEATILRVVSCLYSPTIRQQLSAAVGLSGGAGVRPSEMRHMRTENLRLVEGRWLCDIPGENARTVPVRREYHDVVTVGVEDLRPGQLIIGEKIDRRNVLGNLVDNANFAGDVPRINAQKLRNTWLAWAMTLPMPLTHLLKVAGLRSARNLTDLLPHIAETPIDTKLLADGTPSAIRDDDVPATHDGGQE